MQYWNIDLAATDERQQIPLFLTRLRFVDGEVTTRAPRNYGSCIKTKKCRLRKAVSIQERMAEL